MPRKFYDGDADLSVLSGQTIAVLGYGNQGRSQALNLVDSGLDVVVGNRPDDYFERASQDGLAVMGIGEATVQSDVQMVLLPDELQPEVFQAEIAPSLGDGNCLIFAHGYNIFFDRIDPPPGIDIGMVAPKMIGEGVRRRFVASEGIPTLVGVARDASGTAWERTLAVAKGIGGTRSGAWESTFEEETVTDLFAEQVGGGAALASYLNSFETLVEAGYDPEVIQLELYGSGEMVEVMRGIQEYGLLNSLKLHSPTSQYGQLSRARRLVPREAKQTLKEILEEILDGRFAEEWANERADNYARMDALWDEFAQHQLFEAERSVHQALHRGEDSQT